MTEYIVCPICGKNSPKEGKKVKLKAFTFSLSSDMPFVYIMRGSGRGKGWQISQTISVDSAKADPEYKAILDALISRMRRFIMLAS